ncbi:MAG: glycosyltransferase family 2 protein [Fibrobacter sp.]|nr:glycosyltransferase family 2 protein [Fibrobacter sp.]
MISVVIPSYNRAPLLKRAMESVLNQSYSDIELIVVDDGSTDDTAQVVGKFKDSRVRYVYQKNSGACVARNRGVDEATGDYIAFHDSDDLWHSNKLELQLEALTKQGADVLFCRMNRVVSGKKVGLVSDYFKSGFLPKNELPMSIGTQTLIGKSLVFKQEKFDPEMTRFQEFEMLVRIQKSFSIYCMDDALVDYLLQDDSISKKPERYLQAWNLMLQKHPDFMVTYASSRDRVARDILRNALCVSDRKMRWKMIRMAFKFKTSLKMLARLLCWSYKLR